MNYQFLVETEATNPPPGHGAALRRRLEREVHLAISPHATVTEFAGAEEAIEETETEISYEALDWTFYGLACMAIGFVFGASAMLVLR